MVSYSRIISLSFLGILILSLFSTCEKGESIALEPELRTFPGVDEALWDLFEAFEIEGANRGFEVDLISEGITGNIEAIDEEHVAGQCSYSEIFPGKVTVDSEFWINSSANFKEFIVFHELGHCYLHRGHREDFDDLGRCVSIMRSGLEECRDNYNVLTREQFIDELFNPEEF
ncbi:MAG: hypothetical protein ACI8P3_001666 [Saprospiraceae bacterium]|jgi:hypothetical protein